MAPLKTYKVISEYDISSVEKIVSEHIEKGWIPMGGIGFACTDRNPDIYQYMQAIYLPTTEPVTKILREERVQDENTRRVRMEESFIDELDPELPPEPAPKMNHDFEEEHDAYEDIPF